MRSVTITKMCRSRGTTGFETRIFIQWRVHIVRDTTLNVFSSTVVIYTSGALFIIHCLWGIATQDLWYRYTLSNAVMWRYVIMAQLCRNGDWCSLNSLQHCILWRVQHNNTNAENRPGVPFTNIGLTRIHAWMVNHKTSKLWDEITCLFPEFNGTTLSNNRTANMTDYDCPKSVMEQ